ncbi:hypothetical protein MLD38_006506 [Melastoma candidum]|uniref:Uncharacterized protein n=1 Tax=Melastoma candidum TaxID=119954 RepID=A0ACB9RNN2_9MYRT|nr:hypothetical protein MLD38_006506 [Melastoma candidum]
MMHMTFYWSKEVTLLFSTWTTTTTLSYSLSLLACFLSSLLFHLLDSLRIRLSLSSSSSPSPSDVDPVTRPLLLGFSRKDWAGAGGNPSKWKPLVESALFGINAGLGYMLMLAVMSFNGGVFLSVVAGLSIGYLFFRSGGVVVVRDRGAAAVESNTCACA